MKKQNDILNNIIETRNNLYNYLMDLNHGNVYLVNADSTSSNLMLSEKIIEEIKYTKETLTSLDKLIKSIQSTRNVQATINMQEDNDLTK
ncbi:MAG: hypothetical protein IKM43_00785 [Clostridia bacterium]|nr:hypothetical protein [Clostridia bacterium]